MPAITGAVEGLAIVQREMAMPEEEECKGMFEEMAGMRDNITLDQYLEWWGIGKKDEVSKMGIAVKQKFARHDVNADGLVDREEYKILA